MFLLLAYCYHLLLLFFFCCYWRFAAMSLYFLIAPILYLYCLCSLHFAIMLLRHQPTFVLSSQVILTKMSLKICILSLTVKSGCVSTCIYHSPIIILTMCVDQRISVVPIFYLDKDQNLTTLYICYSVLLQLTLYLNWDFY